MAEDEAPSTVPPTPPAVAGEDRVVQIRTALRRLRAGRLADAVLAGAVMALFFAGILGQLKLDVVASLGTLCVILVLFLLAGYDLFVRWDAVDLQSPDRRSPGMQRGLRRVLRYAFPEIVLVAGIVTGHLLWTG